MDSTEYLNIVEGGAHGKFALRIGHPTEATEMTLRYAFAKADLGVATTTGLAMCMKFKAKLEGTLLDGSWLSITNNVNGAAGNNRTNLSAAELATICSEWSADKFVDVWCGGEYDGARLEFAISLAAGDYFYLDDIRAYGNYSGAGAMKGINVMRNGSFEQWYGSYNKTALYTQDSDFVRIVDGGYSGDYALQLGSADKDTNYTLQVQLNANNAGNYSFDLWAKSEGTVTAADFIMRNGLDGNGTTYSLAGVGTEWIHVEHTEGLTDVAVDSGNLVAELHVQLPAGSYLYIDDVTIVKGYSNDLSNLLSDGGFEGVSSLYYFDTTWESAINEVQKKLGKNWYVSSYNTTNLASSDITAPESAVIPEESNKSVTDTASGIDYYGASLLFHSKTVIRYYFTVTGNISDYVFTDMVNGTTCTPVEKDGMYYVQITGINPYELDTAYQIQVTKADSDEAITVSYNGISYIARVFYRESTSQTLKDLLQAMYDYYIAAEAYVAV